MLFAASALVVGVACSNDDEPTVSDTGTDAAAQTQSDLPTRDDLVAAGGGPGISVDDANASSLDEPLLVEGYVFLVEGRLRLCGAIAESFPPQCGGDAITLIDFDEGDFVFETVGGRELDRGAGAGARIRGRGHDAGGQ